MDIKKQLPLAFIYVLIVISPALAYLNPEVSEKNQSLMKYVVATVTLLLILLNALVFKDTALLLLIAIVFIIYIIHADTCLIHRKRKMIANTP